MMKIKLLMLMIALSCCSFTNSSSTRNASVSKNDIVEVPFRVSEKYLRVRTTYYNPVKEQCWGNPLITADGSKISLRDLRDEKIKWIAISQDLLVEYPLGTKVMVTSKKYPEISGIYEIHDTMAKRIKYSIDILVHQSKGSIFDPHLTEIRKVRV